MLKLNLKEIQAITRTKVKTNLKQFEITTRTKVAGYIYNTVAENSKRALENLIKNSKNFMMLDGELEDIIIDIKIIK